MAGASGWRAPAGSALLVSSGILATAAAAQRWWPACVPGAFDDGGCPRLQDHAHDLVIPTAPWAPVGSAAELYGVGLVVLAAAVLVLPPVLLGRAPGRLLAVSNGLVALGILTVGVLTLLSGLSGSAVSVPGDRLAGALWVLGLPVVALAGIVECVSTERAANGWRLGASTALLAASPIAQVIIAPVVLDYMSHDTTPWTEAFGGVALVLAGGCLLPTRRVPAPLPAPSGAVAQPPSVRREPA